MDSLRNIIIAQRRAKHLFPKIRSSSFPGSEQLLTAPEPTEENRPHSPLLEDLECTVCKEEYREERKYQPRTLSCGHTFCTSCIEGLLTCPKKSSEGKSKRGCPVCRTNIKVSNINNIPVSYTVLNIVLELKQQRLRKRGSYSQCSMKSVGFCKNHNSPKQFWCNSCSVWVCGTCALLKHKEDSNDKCEIQTVDEAVIARKIDHDKVIEKTRESYVGITRAISEAIDICQTSKTLIRFDIALLERKLKESKLMLKSFESIQSKMRGVYSVVDDEWGTYASLSKEVKQAKDYPELEKAVTGYQTLQSRYLLREFFIQFPFRSWTRRLLIECFLEHPNSSFYAEKDETTAKRWLKVSLRWPDLCLHSGGLERPPLGALVFHAGDITGSSNTFFLDICYASEIDMRLKIQISDTSEHLSRFRKFCLGSEDKSYKGLKFCAVETEQGTGAKIAWVGFPEKRKASLVSITSAASNEEKSDGEGLIGLGAMLRSQSQGCIVSQLSNEDYSDNEKCPDIVAESITVPQICMTNDSTYEAIILSVDGGTNDQQTHSPKDSKSRSGSEGDSRSSGSRSSSKALSPTELSSVPLNLRRVQSSTVHPPGMIFTKINETSDDIFSPEVVEQRHFGILLNEAVVANSSHVEIGSVIAGDLKLLTETVRHDNVTRIVIKDCGFQIGSEAETFCKT